MNAPVRWLLAAALPALAFAQAETKPLIAVQAPVIVFTHARVIDGLGHPALENQTIVLREGKIAALGADGSVAVPDGVTVRDLTGKTILPGLVMVHEHLFYSSISKGPF
ncbi:MAG TPA: hypothetical protein VFJ90_09395, partial [Candidatus Didemnitutus sp.]|nr:hypothetical protein [Candidatus Didemnitutus sp.]